MKRYVGHRDHLGRCLVTVEESGSSIPRNLDPCQYIRNHSPYGYNWGYEGSGPAQLSLAILMDVYQDVSIAERYYQQFKRAVIARLRGDNWVLEDFEIRAVVESLAAQRAVRNVEGEDDSA